MTRYRSSLRERARAALRSIGLAVAVNVAFAVAVAGAGTALAQTGAAPAQGGAAPVNVIRPEVGKVLQAVQELMKENKNQEALAKLREADAIPERTATENFTIERIRGAVAARAGDMATAAKAYEAVADAKRLPPAEQQKLIENLGSLYFKENNFPKAIAWLSRYVDEGGNDPQIRMLLVRARYQTNDVATAARELRAMIDADATAGKAPSLEAIQLLSNCYGKLNDTAGYTWALEQLLVHHPKKEYWAEAIQRVETKPNFADSLALDVLRLTQATGNLETAAQYTAMAQLALRGGFPGEAKKIVEQGFAAGVLGTGADADAQRKLRDAVLKQAADDERSIAKDAKSAGTAKDGTALVNTGFALVAAGQHDQGLALMEQGLQKGGLKRVDEAKLHLAIAYLNAGQKAKAVEAFKAVQGGDGTADLAHLWLIHVQRMPG